MIKQKKYIYTIFSLIFAICFIGLFFQSERDLPQIKSKKILKVIIPSDSANNFEIELLRHYLISIQAEAEFKVEKDFKSSIEKLKNGEYDLLLRLIPTTQQLKQEILFTTPIAKTELLLIQNNNNCIKNYHELENDTIYIEKNSPYLTRLHNLQEEVGLENLNIIQIKKSTKELLNDLIDNNINLTIYDEFNLHLLPQNTFVDAETTISTHHFLAWAIAPNCKLLKQDIDKWIKSFTNSLEYRDLIRKHYR